MEQEGYLAEPARRWVQDVADREYGGNWGRAAAAIIEAACEAERRPDDPWAYLTARQRSRDGR
ncbi:hypothetical protein FHX34_103480 [Actinoplanes teichomyceticus]|uniref:Uncharacterized protein n=2 Tax=Actinoplanes teichomyceticus TaxID=1867 RepID=A0A561WAR7_ACTTI|nr:hypothetical protein FHX34_103480 [Actinoplanes teichomyceticus]GIF16537.1 hypothetical protein Ate01nite_65690 [Actinoplanes teichomyceticus]